MTLRHRAYLVFRLMLLAGMLAWRHEAVAAKVSPGSAQNAGNPDPLDLPTDLMAKVDGLNEGDETLTEDAKDNDLVVAPLPSRNPSLGWTIAVPAMYMYHPEGVDENSSTWITGIGGFYAENKSWGAGGFHRMSLDDDRWRVSGAAFYGDLRYDYYGIGERDTVALPLRQKTSFYMAEGLYAVKESLYLGLKGIFAQSLVGLDVSGIKPGTPAPPSILDQEIDIVSLTPRLRYDTRNNEFYPSEGLLLDTDAAVGLEDLGGMTDYELYKVAFNIYHELGDRGVLAARFAMEYAAGDAPFFVYPAFGSGADLRGYTTGTYRDRGLLAGQLEYRHRVTSRLGLVAFGGVGTVSPDFLGWTETLPSYGVGFRWVVAKKNDMSIRFDYAWGKDDEQFYVGLGEAF